MTDRISSFQSSPATTFYVEGDVVSQNQAGNSSVVRCYLRAVNGPGGTTGSAYNGSGSQAGTIVGIATFRTHTGNPFLPSGFANGATRWREGPYDVTVPHDADGTGSFTMGMVLAYGSVNATSFSGPVALPTIGHPAPSGLAVARVSDSTQRLSWRLNGAGTAVRVFRRVDGGAWVQPFATLAAGATTWDDTSTSAGHSYEYAVAQVASNAVSDWSNHATINVPPPAPTGLKVTRVSDSRQDLSWSRPTTYTNVLVERRVDGGAWSQIASLGNVSAYSDTSTSAGHKYEYRVRGTSTGGTSAYSSTVQISIPLPAPTSVAGTRVSDGRVDVSWVKTGTATSVVVQRSTGGGPWQQVGAPSGNITSFSDTTTGANARYVYRVALVSPGGQSAWSASSASVYTSPPAPTGVSAVRSGSSIIVDASSVSGYATGVNVMDGATVVASGVSLPWTHVSPNASVPHTYKLQAVVPDGLTGPWSSPSNTVQLIAPPLAPTSLTPNGGVVALDDTTTLHKWVHNPVDSSGQTAYQVQYRSQGDTTWTVRPAVTATYSDTPLIGSMSAAGFTPTPGVPVEWQVRTKGADPNFGPWSAVAVVTVITRPGVAVTQPDTTWDASVLNVGWSWFQPEGRPQSAWRLELLDSNAQVVETRSGSGATSTFTVTTRLTPGDWTVRVQAATGDVWSPWGEQTFTVVFDPPAPPLLDGSWSEETGVVTLTVTPGGVVGPVDVAALVQDDRWVLWDAIPDETTAQVVEPVPPATTRLLVERLDGTTWTTVLDGPDGVTFTDAQSPSFGDIVYRATAFTVEGAAAVTEIIVSARSTALWLSGGPGFMTTCRLPMSPNVQASASRDRVLKQYAGRAVPVAFAGEGTSKTWQVSGMVTDRTFIEPTASPDDLLALAQDPEALFLFRDPDGRRLAGAIGDVQLGRQATTTDPDLRPWNAFWGFSFTLTEATGV